MVKRNRIHKAQNVVCKECGKTISAYSIAAHISRYHNLEEYIEKYGEFRKNILNKKRTQKRITNYVKCKICNNTYTMVGFSNHLRDTHYLTTEEYVKKYGEFRKKYLDHQKKIEESKIFCMICNKKFISEKELTYHIKKEHCISKKKYIIKYFFKNNIPKCKCGCGKEVSLIYQYPYSRTFLNGHNSKGKLNSNFGKIVSDKTREQMKTAAIKRMGNSNKKNTEIELKFKKILERLKIKFIQQYPTPYGAIDFYLPNEDMYIEIDGEYWHPLIKENLNMQLISGAIHEVYKENLGNKLYRIRPKDLNNISSIQDIEKYNKHPDFKINYKQKIIMKEYFKNYIDKKGKDKLEKYVPLLLKFVRTLIPEFPVIPSKEKLLDVVDTIQNYDVLNKIYNNQQNIFRNNCSNVGVNYLKANFSSYWKSKYKTNKVSPREAWYSDDIMKKVIKYRIGINNSNEIFDFSIHQLIRGLSARRYTISFFKPILAAAIYKKLLENIKKPTVIDPCAGFGGRLLGFISKYPHGTYIGIEPNKETFKELMILKNQLENLYILNNNQIQLYNCKYEDFILKEGSAVDLIFTSIPYYDKEIYSEHVFYKNYEEWKNIFIESIKWKYKNVKHCINIHNDLIDIFDDITICEQYKIMNNTSHFNKTKLKYEQLIVF